MMELSEIGIRLGIDNRVLRYLMEQKLVPGLQRVNKGRGSRRKLTTAQARLVGVAAMLHVEGFRPPAITKILKKVKRDLPDGNMGIHIQLSKELQVVIDVEKIYEIIP